MAGPPSQVVDLKTLVGTPTFPYSFLVGHEVTPQLTSDKPFVEGISPNEVDCTDLQDLPVPTHVCPNACVKIRWEDLIELEWRTKLNWVGGRDWGVRVARMGPPRSPTLSSSATRSPLNSSQTSLLQKEFLPTKLTARICKTFLSQRMSVQTHV